MRGPYLRCTPAAVNGSLLVVAFATSNSFESSSLSSTRKSEYANLQFFQQNKSSTVCALLLLELLQASVNEYSPTSEASTVSAPFTDLLPPQSPEAEQGLHPRTAPSQLD